MAEIQNYYDDLAKYYKLVYFDWEGSVKRQAQVLDAIIQENFGNKTKRILDVGCGIGTQSIGLAELGYEISAVDISEEELKLAEHEAKKRNLSIDFRWGDMRRADQLFEDQFDLVMSCDNCILHLLMDEDILQAFSSFYNALKADGGVMVSVRDYAKMEKGGQRFFPRHIHKHKSGKTILFDVWEFEDEFYNMTTYVIDDDGSNISNVQTIRGGRYYCVTTEKLEYLFKEAGFSKIQTITDKYFQPVIVAHKQLHVG